MDSWLISSVFFFLTRHRVINIFLRTYRELWLADENVGQEIIIEDLTVSQIAAHIQMNNRILEYWTKFYKRLQSTDTCSAWAGGGVLGQT